MTHVNTSQEKVNHFLSTILLNFDILLIILTIFEFYVKNSTSFKEHLLKNSSLAPVYKSLSPRDRRYSVRCQFFLMLWMKWTLSVLLCIEHTVCT